jgi:prepilin-type N-terminal cleavage/methylation domain-containing protein
MRPRPSGFTLVELMVVVAIIGLLSSIAIPQFRNFQLRARQSERTVVMKAIYDATEDYFMREGRYPQGTPASSVLSCQWNPALLPTTQKRAWSRSPSSGDWSKLSLQLDGHLYYSYYAYGLAEGGRRYRYVYTYGDLDGDRRYNTAYHLVEDYGTSAAPQTYVSDYDSAQWDQTF